MNSYYTDLILYKTFADLRAESARGHIGIFWWIIEPILYMLVFYVGFSVMRREKGTHFVAYLLVGLLPWKWFASTLSVGAKSILNGGDLMQQVYFPKYIFPSVVMLTNFFKFMIVMALLLVLFVLWGSGPLLTWFALPGVILLQFLVMMSLTYLFASIVPLFPDLRQIIDNGLLLVFFVSGIVFDVSNAPPEFKPILYLNPMVTLTESYRAILLDGQWPAMKPLLVMLCVSILVGTISIKIMVKFDREYPKFLMR